MNRWSAVLMISALALAGCNEKVENTCGNGALEIDEICDGDLFAQDLNIFCPDGSKPRMDAVKCTSMCTLDTTAACGTVCGNNVIEGDEQCDGTAMPMVKAGCDQPDMSKLSCLNCRVVDNGVCPKTEDEPVDPPVSKPDWISKDCGNGQLDEGELCDGSLIDPSAKVCPENMIKKGNAEFRCLDSCRLLDISNACVYGDVDKIECGNNVLEGDEQCDGTEFSNDALNSIQCGSGEILDIENTTCSASCEIQAACKSSVNRNAGLLISEVVPHIESNGNTMSINGLAVEITNLSNEKFDASSCSLAMFSPTKIELKFPLSELGVGEMKAFETKVLCSQSGADSFKGVCDGSIADNGILNNLAGKSLLGIVCGDRDEIVDLFNLNSFISAVQNYGVDFIRECDAVPVTEPSNALLGEGWFIDSYMTNAPTFDLGQHCSMTDGRVESCTYTISRNELTNRGQAVELALEIKIPGITDVSDKTDVASGLQIHFVSGDLKNGTVNSSMIHLITPHADTDWTNSEGVDRYVGKLRNWDLYEGFLSSDVGTYVLDASISFDNGKTRTYCGPKGIVTNYSAYNSSMRNTLTVSYDDNGGTCNDGVISASEVCDGFQVREEALDCEMPGEIVYDRSKVVCSCSMLSTIAACGVKPATCGNGVLDDKEVCDGSEIPDSVKKCPVGMVVRSNPEWSCSTCLGIDIDKACDIACGNGQLDAGEICDGNEVAESEKVCPKNYVPKQDAKWGCDNMCKVVNKDDACELACGNGKLDDKETCDGSAIDMDAASAACKKGTTFDASRVSCDDTCNVDTATCVYDKNLVFDEFFVKKDENGKAEGVAISINYYGDEPFDIGACNVSILNERGTFAVSGAMYFSLLDMVHAGEGASSYELAACKPIVICSEPMASASEYKDIWGDKCDAVLGGFDENNKLIDNLFLNYPAIDTLQLSCGGVKVDFMDFAGLRDAISQGYTHGKLKSADQRPWAGRMSVDINKRMDLDKTTEISAFATPVCK